MTLKVWILQSLRRLFITLVAVTMTWFSEKIVIFDIIYLMPNLIQKSWTVSIVPVSSVDTSLAHFQMNIFRLVHCDFRAHVRNSVPTPWFWTRVFFSRVRHVIARFYANDCVRCRSAASCCSSPSLFATMVLRFDVRPSAVCSSNRRSSHCWAKRQKSAKNELKKDRKIEGSNLSYLQRFDKLGICSEHHDQKPKLFE